MEKTIYVPRKTKKSTKRLKNWKRFSVAKNGVQTLSEKALRFLEGVHDVKGNPPF